MLPHRRLLDGPCLATAAAVLALSACGAPRPRADPPTASPAPLAAVDRDGEPPVLVYDGTRRSERWVRLDGGNVPLDRGVTWQGVEVHLSPYGDLVAFDADTARVRWVERSLSDYWRTVTFVRVGSADDARWAVELRPVPRADTDGLRLRRDLRTGAPVDPPPPASPGVPLPVDRAWSGGDGSVAQRFRLVVGTEAGWQRVVARLFGPADPALDGAALPPQLGLEPSPLRLAGKVPAVDFATHVALIVSDGDALNRCGIAVAGVFEDQERLVVRLRPQGFQTAVLLPPPEPRPAWDRGPWRLGRPYAIALLPRRPGKAIELQVDRQDRIGGPPLWREAARWSGIPDAASELDGLP